MGSSQLDNVRATGLTSLNRDETALLLAELGSLSRRSSEPRYDLLAAFVERVETWRERHDPAGGVPRETLSEIDVAFATALSTVQTARGQRPDDDIDDILERLKLLPLDGPDVWLKRGQARRQE